MVTPTSSPKLILALLMLAFGSISALAKREAPKDVPPVIVGGVRYTAPHWTRGKARQQQGGYLEARDVATGRQLWDLRIYEIKYDQDLERDVQDIFITSLKVVGGKLQVVNEKGDKFVVDLSRRKVIEGRRRVYECRP